MKQYFDWDMLREDARAAGLKRTGTIASSVCQSISLGEDRVFIGMEHSLQRGLALNREELLKILFEMDEVKQLRLEFGKP